MDHSAAFFGTFLKVGEVDVFNIAGLMGEDRPVLIISLPTKRGAKQWDFRGRRQGPCRRRLHLGNRVAHASKPGDGVDPAHENPDHRGTISERHAKQHETAGRSESFKFIAITPMMPKMKAPTKDDKARFEISSEMTSAKARGVALVLTDA